MSANKFYTVSITVEAKQPPVTFDIESSNPLNADSPQKKIGTINLPTSDKNEQTDTWYFDPDSEGNFNGTLTFTEYKSTPLTFGSNPTKKGKLIGGAYTVDYSPLPDSGAKTVLMVDPPGFEAKVP